MTAHNKYTCATCAENLKEIRVMEKVDVIEVSIASGEEIRVIAEDKTPEQAETIIEMAVIRRGVEESFFTTRPAR